MRPLSPEMLRTEPKIGTEIVHAERSFSVHSPYSGEVIANVADCGVREARLALDAADEAYRSWSRITPFERAGVLMRWHDAIVEHAEELASIMTLEMGKTIRESRGEVLGPTAGFVSWYAEEAKRGYGQVIPTHAERKRLFAFRKPIGPVLAITPWNFPASMVTRKASAALAAGCTVILKPAEQSPLSALLLGALWDEAGGPPGTLQIIPTSRPGDVTQALIEDDRIRKVSFTGSTEVGRLVNGRAAMRLKKVSLELGGHAPFLVLADADVERAVEQAIIAKFRNIGQSCVAANRLFVHDSIVGQFAQRYAEAAARLKVGDPTDEDTDIGPLVNDAAVEKVAEHVRDAVERGAQVLSGGRQQGRVFHPTVLTSVHPEARILNEETFGPIAPITPFEDMNEAISMANDVNYGLAAYVWTRSLSDAFHAIENLDYGIVGINDGVPAAPHVPFGGRKDSGFGKEGGHWGLDEYLETTFASVQLP